MTIGHFASPNFSAFYERPVVNMALFFCSSIFRKQTAFEAYEDSFSRNLEDDEEEEDEEEELEDEEAVEENEGGDIRDLRRLSTILRDEDEPEFQAGTQH